MVTDWNAVGREMDEAREEGRVEGLKQAANWLRRQASAEKDATARGAFVEAHNAVLAMTKGGEDDAQA